MRFVHSITRTATAGSFLTSTVPMSVVEGLFLGFPDGIDWFRAALSRAGQAVGVSAEEHEPLAAALEMGRPPELIAVTNSAHSPLVLVEGHYRLTAYALFPASLPPELEILLGVSDEITSWCQF
jgi:hypothetical protein